MNPLKRRFTDPSPKAPTRRRPLVRQILFAVLPLTSLLLAATLALAPLERAGCVHTRRDGDRVLYLDEAYLRVVREDGRSFLQLMDAQRPELPQARFLQKKPPGTLRIVVVGGSFVRGEHHIRPGEPVRGYGSIPAWLGALLELRHPSRSIEVINAGGSGQSSNSVRASVEKLLQADPDIVVIADGSNEGSLPPTPYNEGLHRWILYRAMKRSLLDEIPPESRPLLQPQEAPPDAIRENFGRNLDRMVAACARAGANAVLVTLPVNYTGYVLGRGGRGGPPGNGRIPSAAEQEGMRLCEESRVPEALERFGAHTHSVEALVASAECLLRSGDYDEAREFIGRAIEEIPLGTARPSFNALIRETALRSELPLVDLETRLLEASPHGISGGEYFWDHLHMSCDGYLWAARQIDGVLEAAGLIPSAPGEPLAPPELEAILEKKGWKKIHSEVAAHGY